MLLHALTNFEIKKYFEDGSKFNGVYSGDNLKYEIKVATYIINWLYVLVMSRTRFRVNPHSILAWKSNNSLLETGAKPEV